MNTEIKKIEELEGKELSAEKRLEMIRKIASYLFTKNGKNAMKLYDLSANEYFKRSVKILPDGRILEFDGEFEFEPIEEQIARANKRNITSKNLGLILSGLKDQAIEIISSKMNAVNCDAVLTQVCEILK